MRNPLTPKRQMTASEMVNPHNRARARRNDWTVEKMLRVDVIDADASMLQMALSKGKASKDDDGVITMNVDKNGVEATVDCERCDDPVGAGNFMILPDRSPAHKFACE